MIAAGPMTQRGAAGFPGEALRGPVTHAGIVRILALLLGLLLLAIAGRARADCEYTNRPGTVTFTPPSTITLPDTLSVGDVLWTSAPIVPADYPTLTCSGNTNSGVINQAGMPAGSDKTLFPTNVLGLSYRLLHPDTSNPLNAYPDEIIPAGTYNFSVATALQLVVTGTITPGSVFNGGQIAQWNMDMCDVFFFFCRKSRGTNPVEVFNSSSIRFIAPACTIVTDPTIVTLPVVVTANFNAPGSVAGQTPFNLQLNCPSSAAGANIMITLATNSPIPGATGVIANTNGGGFATNVGVQVLDGNGNPLPFATAIPAGTVTAGVFNIPLNARYYQTGAPVAAGQVKATATYTLTYQ